MDKKPKHKELEQSEKSMKPGEHLCFIYKTEKEHRALLTPFMRQGLERGEKVLYILDTHTREKVLKYLLDDGVVVEPYLESGQLVITTADEVYIKERIFDPDAMIELLREETERSLKEGYKALRITGEMTWVLKGPRGSERLIEYEAKVNKFLPGSKCLAICQYDKRKFKPKILSDVLATHPIAVIGTEIFDNIYYVSPKDLLSPDPEAAKLDKRLASLLELKHSGRALYESEEKYRRLFVEARDGIFIADAETGILIDCNDEAMRLVGRYKSEIIGQHQKFLHPPGQDNEKFSETFQRHLKESAGQDLETQVITSTGEIREVAIKANILHVGNRKLLQGIFHDITDRKRARESLKLFRALIEQSNDAIEVLDPKTGYFLDVNKKGCEDLGYSREELLSLRIFDIDPKIDPSLYRDYLMQELRKTGSLSQETLHLRKDGTTFPVEINLSYVKLDRDYLVTIARDITERKRAEEALKESEEKFKTVAEQSPNMIFINSKGKVIYANKLAEEIMGFKRDEFYSPDFDFLSLIAPEYIQLVNSKYKDHMEGKEVDPYEYSLITREGKRIDVVINTKLIDYDGQSAILGIVTDITDRKRAEETIRESEKKYRTILESIEEGYYETDIQGNFTFFNDSMRKILGYTRDELIRMNYRDFLSPETGKNVYKIFNKIYQTGQPARILDYEFIKKDGSKISIEASASLIRDSKDKPVGFRGIIRDVTEGKKIETELIRTKNFLQNIFDSSAECITTTDLHGNMIYVSPRVKDILGYDHKKLIGKKVHSLYSNGKEDAKVIMKTITEKAELRNHEMKLARKDGSLVDINLSASLLKNEKGETIGTLGIYSDVTEKKRLDVQLQQARKMEAIGTLAGGIAHDFNNILTSIIGNAELMLINSDNDEYLREGIEEIKIAGERAASLTRQLLAFSRKQMIQPKILDLNALLAGIKNMLVRLIGENIEILVIPESGLWQIKIDPGQMEQVIMNLAVNARDAMPNGGKLIIQTANMYLDEDYFDRQRITVEEQPGSYVMMAVSDTGSGIDKKTQEHIFEPFYSTKEKGKGTGLGLSTVYGIVKQNKGFVWVYSEAGQGTTFKIYLPSAKEVVKTEERAQTPVKDLGGSETILVVEDNVSILNLAQRALNKYGYKVLTANSGEDALRICREYKGPIDLLLTDVVMPTMSGKETAERLQPLYPQMKVIYMSGYTDDAIVHLGVLEPGLNFLEKPFSPEVLAVKVREVLNK